MSQDTNELHSNTTLSTPSKFLHPLRLFGNAILCVAGFSVYFLAETSPTYSSSRISCDETLATEELVINFDCARARDKRLVTRKHVAQDVTLEVKSDRLVGSLDPEVVELEEDEQIIPVDAQVEEVELTIEPATEPKTQLINE